MAYQRLSEFEKGSQFESVLQTYNDQMLTVEGQNLVLTQEIKRLSQIQEKIKINASDKTLEYNYKKLLGSFKKLTQNYEKCNAELTEFRKKERIYNLHKKCAEDTTKKLSFHGKKINNQMNELNEKKVQIENM